MSLKVCHITTLHPRNDVRIFYKQCLSLAKNHQVTLIVADGKGNDTLNGVQIVDIQDRPVSRVKRAWDIANLATKKALELDADVYHFHDPELLRITPRILKAGKKVIYDVHEDLPRQIMGKPYIPQWLRPIVSSVVERIENRYAKKLSGIICATPFIRDRFLKLNPNTIDINNYPKLDEFEQVGQFEKKNQVCYVGNLTDNRGIYPLIQSFKNLDIPLVIAGQFGDAEFQKKCESLPEWSKVDYRGFVDRATIAQITGESKVGMVTLKPLINYLDALPVKMFEYMLAGLPVVASDFPLWRSIVVDNDCGLCVDPLKPDTIAEAIRYILEHPEHAQKMSENGQAMVRNQLNWTIESEKLYRFYQKIEQI